MKWLGAALLGPLAMGCVTKVTAVQRAMLAPLPPAPLLAFETERGGEVGLETQVRPGPIAPTTSTSGVGVPLLEFRGAPMIRVSKKLAFGGALEVVPGDGAQFQSPESQLISSRRPAVGALLGGHFNAFEVGAFGLDGAAQVSLHWLPVDVSRAPGPLGSTPGSTVATETTVIPGVAVTLIPRVTTRVGTFFAGVQAHSNADIEARGVRVNMGATTVTDDLGSTRELLGQVGLGYSITFGAIGFTAQAWLPFSAARFGYVPWVGFSLRAALGKRPAEQPRPPVDPPPREQPDTPTGPPPLPPL